MKPNQPLPLIAGNWKMNGCHQNILDFGSNLGEQSEALGERPVDIVLCPPAVWVAETAAYMAPTKIRVGAQDCSHLPNGAHTGDISAEMLKRAGCSLCIVGHSERRRDHGETDVLVRAKAEAVLAQGLAVIVCVGETEEERDAGKTLEVVGRQLAASVPNGAASSTTVVAYEPVWAIGTGRTPTMEQIAELHAFLRDSLYERFDYDGFAVRILYGGSVTPDNAKEILHVDHVNGALVGGASLKLDTFWPIVEAAPIPQSAGG